MIDSSLLKKLEKIRILTDRKITASFAGDYRSAFKGRGMEFEEVRPYQAGDDIRLIDWNVTARSNEPFVKVFKEERELTVFLMVDLSASGLYSSSDRSKNELAAELCAMLAFTAIKNNDRVGLLIFTDQVEKVIPPSKGSRHVMHLIRELMTFTPQNKGTSIKEALEYARKINKAGSVTILISDFFDEGYEGSLGALSEKSDCLCLHLYDPREIDPPKGGLFRLYDPEEGKSQFYDGLNKKQVQLWKKQSLKRHSQLEKSIRSKGSDYLSLKIGDDWIKSLTALFLKRGAQR